MKIKLENMEDVRNAEVGTIIPIKMEFEDILANVDGLLLCKDGNSRLFLTKYSGEKSPLEIYWKCFIEDIHKEQGIQNERFCYSVKDENNGNVALFKTNQKDAQRKYLEAKTE